MNTSFLKVSGLFRKLMNHVFRRDIEDYGFPAPVVDAVSSIVASIERGDIPQVENQIAALALDICNRVEKRILSPKEGDSHFALLDRYIDEHYPNLQIADEVKNIIFEGTLFHDYGTEHGPDINRMRTAAMKFVNDGER